MPRTLPGICLFRGRNRLWSIVFGGQPRLWPGPVRPIGSSRLHKGEQGGA